MLSTSQSELCAGIVSQYNYYVVYYRYDYTEYTVGMERDYLIELVCSDQLPTFENGVYNFTECNYYKVIDNKYMDMSVKENFSFRPVSASDIVYTNIVEGSPQLCYEISSFKNYDFEKAGVYVLVIVFAFAVVLRLLFGGVK